MQLQASKGFGGWVVMRCQVAMSGSSVRELIALLSVLAGSRVAGGGGKLTELCGGGSTDLELNLIKEELFWRMPRSVLTSCLVPGSRADQRFMTLFDGYSMHPTPQLKRKKMHMRCNWEVRLAWLSTLLPHCPSLYKWNKVWGEGGGGGGGWWLPKFR